MVGGPRIGVAVAASSISAIAPDAFSAGMPQILLPAAWGPWLVTKCANRPTPKSFRKQGKERTTVRRGTGAVGGEAVRVMRKVGGRRTTTALGVRSIQRKTRHGAGAAAARPQTKESKDVTKLRVLFEGRRKILRLIRDSGEKWGDAAYDAAWFECEKAKRELDWVKPAIPRPQKLQLLLGDLAQAEVAAEKAKAAVQGAEEQLEKEKEKLATAEGKVERQKQRVAEFKGEAHDGGDEVRDELEERVTAAIRPFASTARSKLDKVGVEIQAVASEIECGGDLQKCHGALQLMLGEMWDIRQQAARIEGEEDQEDGEYDDDQSSIDAEEEGQEQTYFLGSETGPQQQQQPEDSWHRWHQPTGGEELAAGGEKTWWNGRWWFTGADVGYKGDQATARAIDDAQEEERVAIKFGYKSQAEGAAKDAVGEERPKNNGGTISTATDAARSGEDVSGSADDARKKARTEDDTNKTNDGASSAVA